MHRKGMKVFRLETDDGEVVEGDANDLEAIGIDSSQVRLAVSNQKKYRGYTCTIIGIREKSISEPIEKIKRVSLDDFSRIANSEHKSYGQLQTEEALGRVIRC